MLEMGVQISHSYFKKLYKGMPGFDRDVQVVRRVILKVTGKVITMNAATFRMAA